MDQAVGHGMTPQEEMQSVVTERLDRDPTTVLMEAARIIQGDAGWPTEPLQLKAQPGVIAASLADTLDQLLPARPGLMIGALLFIVAGAVKLGWELRGLWGPLVDNRGWAALVVFSIVGSVFMVNYSNRRG